MLRLRDGTLLIATGAGLASWGGRQLVRLQGTGLDGIRCNSLAQDSRGDIWVGTRQGVWVGRGGRFEARPVPGKTPGNVYQVLVHGEQVLAAGANGLWSFPVVGPPLPVSGPPGVGDPLRCAAFLPGELYLGTATQGLFVRRGEKWQSLTDQVQGRFIYRLTVAPSGILYVATNDAGLYVRKPGQRTFQHWDTSTGLPSEVVNLAFEDREGGLWVGTDIGGLAHLGGTQVSNYSDKQGLPNSCVFGISPGPTSDSLWVGTLQGLALLEVRPKPQVLEILDQQDGLENGLVWESATTRDGTLWIRTDTGVQYRPKGQKRVLSLKGAPFDSADVFAVRIDEQDRVWVTSSSRRCPVAMLDGSGPWRVWTQTESGVPIPSCRELAGRRAGGVFASAGLTILACDGNTVVEVGTTPGLDPGTGINTLLEDSRGQLWAGGVSGLTVRRTDGKWRTVTEEEGLTSRHIYSAAEDGKGVIWLGTTHGAFRLHPNGRIESVTPDDGLASWEMNEGAIWRDPAGDIWMGTINGLSHCRDVAQAPNQIPARMVVEAAALSGRTVDFPTGLNLDWKSRTVTFRVAVLSFRNRNRVGYRARLEGLESEWLPISRLPELRYTNLPPGSLRLLLQSTNDSGLWSDITALPIRVAPP
ncbi:MAG: hypothetical protein EHM61_28790, partial [Acidobacteria bacterium]